MKYLLPFLLFILSCKETILKKEACRKENGFIHCAYLNSEVEVSLHLKDENGQFYGNVNTLASTFAKNKQQPLLLMNAGMFHSNLMPVGLYREANRTLVSVDTSTTKSGNFYLQPNGIFIADNQAKKFEIIARTVESPKSPLSRGLAEKGSPFIPPLDKGGWGDSATQSGPMLLINEKINPLFHSNAKHRQIRNGVGISKDSLHFVMSESEVTFHEFADFFKQQNCQNALYLDGYVSQLKSPTFYKNPNKSTIGPMLSVWAR